MPDTGAAFVTYNANPRATIMVPNVAMKGGKRIKVTMTPLAAPHSPPTIMPNSIPNGTGNPALTDIAAATPDRATTEPVLKSMPPVKITMVAPIPINAIVEVCKPMVNTLFKVKKYSLLIVNAIINRINPASDASLRNISFCFSFISYLLSFSSEHIFYACRILHNFFLIGFFRFKKCGHFSLTHDDNAIGHA